MKLIHPRRNHSILHIYVLFGLMSLNIKWLKAVHSSSSHPLPLVQHTHTSASKVFFTFIFMFSLMRCNCEPRLFFMLTKNSISRLCEVWQCIPAGWQQSLWNQLGKTLPILCVNPTNSICPIQWSVAGIFLMAEK